MRKLFVPLARRHRRDVRVRADRDRATRRTSRRCCWCRRSSTSTCRRGWRCTAAIVGLRRRERDLPVQGSPSGRPDRGRRPPSSPCSSALFGLVTGSLWGRKAWGVWWQWDARLTMALLLELIFFGYLLRAEVRRSRVREARGRRWASSAWPTSPFVYKSVDWWRTIHPKTSVVPTLGSAPMMLAPLSVLHGGVPAAVRALLLVARVRLEERRAELDQLYLAEED